MAVGGDLREITLEQLSEHRTASDCWVAIHGLVYNLTGFLEVHPGGGRIILSVAGTDATQTFDLYHDAVTVLTKYAPPKLDVVGRLAGQDLDEVAPAREVMGQYGNGGYGDKVAFADPAWYQNWHSPYYNESHQRLRAWAREIVERELVPYIDEWERAGGVPPSVYKKFGDLGFLSAITGWKEWPSKWAKQSPPCGIAPTEWDEFHELVVADELARCGSSGVASVLSLGPSIALPTVMRFGSPFLQDLVVPAVLNGDKTIALAITEPYAGSDVANLQTTAKLDQDGKHYILNGEKKWITNGVWADYFVVAARTGGKGMSGITLFLIERSRGGIETRPMPCQGNVGSGTAFVVLENTRVPTTHIVGTLNKGFKAIMANFNHERLGICVSSIRASRICYEVAMKHAHRRRTFGQKLFHHGVIRNKLAQMARQIEAAHAWLELIVFQLKEIKDSNEATLRMGGPIALLKAHSTQMLEYCSREATQILGGLGYTRGGVGGKVERIYRDVRGYAIPGGSEEIMLDLGIRQAAKLSQMMGAKL